MATLSECVRVRAAKETDARAIAPIDNYQVLKTIVTFEERKVSAAEMIRRMSEIEAASLPWLVAEQDSAVRG